MKPADEVLRHRWHGIKGEGAICSVCGNTRKTIRIAGHIIRCGERPIVIVAAGAPERRHNPTGKARRRAIQLTRAERPIRCCYADPVYVGRGRAYSVPGTAEYHPDAMRWDDIDEHVALMRRLDVEFLDGWAMSCSGDSAAALHQLAPLGTRLAVWCRGGPRLNLRISPGWEGVLFRSAIGPVPGRPKVQDWLLCGIGHTSGDTPRFYGAKPRKFCRWMFELLALGGHPEDELVDLFPGSGAVTTAWDGFKADSELRRSGQQRGLFA